MANDNPNQRCAELRIGGMTCASCEILLERKLKKVPGVLSVNIDHRTGKANIVANANALPDGEQIESVVRDAGYHLMDGSAEQPAQEHHGKAALKVCIDGMTSPADERLLRQKLKLVPNVHNASVHFGRGTANIYYKGTQPLWEDLKEAVESAGYQLRHPDETPSEIEPPHRKWMEIGGALLVVFAIYKLLQAFDLVSLAPSVAGASNFGSIFLIGLVAGTSSCLAVTGGLLLTVAAKYNETHQAGTKWEKFKPLLSFNIGRIVSYFLLGGIVGVIGHSVTLTPRMTGYMSVAVAFIMLYLALSILKIIPKGKLGIRSPKALSHWIAGLSESDHPLAPFALGAGTFFLPCGFTQSLQLAALASGSFITGSLTMGIFALGTLPSLIGISAISSTAKGTFSRLFLRFAGVLVFVLALFNINNGLLLTGIDLSSLIPNFSGVSSPAYAAGSDPNVTQNADGTQTINMHVTPSGYEPSSFTVIAGKPTKVKATADANLGCTSVLTAPTYGLVKYLQAGENELGPITPTQSFVLTCSMGMYRANVTVANAGNGGAPTAAAAPAPSVAGNTQVPANAQDANLTWTAYGYSPPILEVKQGHPTAVHVSATSRASGCISTIVFPQFDQSGFVPEPGAPANTLILATDKAQPGDYPIVCGMGIKMGVLRVTPS